MALTIRVAAPAPLAGAAWLLAGTLAHAEPAPAQPVASTSRASPAPVTFRVAQESGTSAPETAAPPAAEIMPVAPLAPGWRITLVPYLWFGGVKSSLAFSPPVGSRSTIEANVDTKFSDIFRDLNSGFMGAGEVRRDKFSVQTDIIYMNVSQSGSRVRDVTGPFGHTAPFNLGGKLKLKTTLWTLSGGYDVFRNDRNFVQLFAGFRYLGVNSTLDWGFQGPIADVPRAGTVKAGDDVWNGIAGVRGESAMGGSRWKMIYYGDVGSGGSKLTWQTSAAFAYALRRGDIGLGWRYLEYQPHDGRVPQSLRMSGPMIIGHYRFGG